jgi:hypothetical protein
MNRVLQILLVMLSTANLLTPSQTSATLHFPVSGAEIMIAWQEATSTYLAREGGVEALLTGALISTSAASSLSMCGRNLPVCMPEDRLDTMLMLTDPTTLIGHLTLDEYVTLTEVTTVIEMYLTEDTLNVRFFGGAWPGSRLSVFETSFFL